ncbi:hypothetical protein OIU77_013456 [Salix suchowensis]|uniref:Uncharacterized protein n=1 Tax=Salix suchowensis TaxID=1278906 RepID=A0ABQ8ZU38_9ROSI|nr:hypothetical protein OIU77_013456 [Salix suchowensis]
MEHPSLIVAHNKAGTEHVSLKQLCLSIAAFSALSMVTRAERSLTPLSSSASAPYFCHWQSHGGATTHLLGKVSCSASTPYFCHWQSHGGATTHLLGKVSCLPLFRFHPKQLVVYKSED